MKKEDALWEWRKVLGQWNKAWGAFIGDETMKAEGRLDILYFKIQYTYGKSKKEAIKMLNDFFDKRK